ncbi:MAG: hypothetical protein IJ616_02320 [Bacteroidales bacterium]|nr:hypothetical protein [Bacteroidales bacterium]
MKRIRTVIFILMMTACTIKEDRTFCPCYLTIDFVDLPLQWQNDDKSLWMDV